MKTNITIFLLLALVFSSGTLLVDRFLVSIPDWLAIILSLLAIISLIYHFVLLKKNKN